MGNSGTPRNYNLAAPFFDMAARHPERVAIVAAGQTVSYGELARRAAGFAGHVAPHLVNRRIGVLATRSIEAYVAILGTCLAGATYVPLSQKWPEDRLLQLLPALGLDALAADVNGAAMLTPAVIAAGPRQLVIADAAAALDALPEGDGRSITRFEDIAAPAVMQPAQVGPDETGYIIFTSGSTGLPKGVAISAGSLDAYLTHTRPWARIEPADRVAEACDVTFDLSVHNLFLTLEAGASLHLMSALELMAPARFIRSHEISVWLSVPTLANMMRRNGALKPGIFPSLRLSMFCGEPLPLATAQGWAEAAPGSTVENIYGPTEFTVICMRQSLTPEPKVTEGRGIIAIGRPYANTEVAILDASLSPLPDGQAGEIALSGPQLGIGYVGQPALTADRFRTIDGRRWYLTGDLGRRNPDGTFHHLGRIDNQVKIKGNRIELEEVEAHLRHASGTDVVAVVAWPIEDDAPQGLAAFVAGSARSESEMKGELLRTLPRFLVPEVIWTLDTLPVNVNGKVDRRALRGLLEEKRLERSVA